MKRKPKVSTTDTTAPKKQHWMLGLLASMEDPELKVKEDDKVVVIKDKYPKAQFHYLILPKENIPSLWHVKKENEDLLLHMARVAEDLTMEHKDCEFLIGYHAVPSMHRLHLHVISTDFNSPCLKTKYHWNSFTTPFFLHSRDHIHRSALQTYDFANKIDPLANQAFLKRVNLICEKMNLNPQDDSFGVQKDICKQLQETGEVEKVNPEDSAQHLNTPLKCHKCSQIPKNMPDLKRHLLTHLNDRRKN